MIQLVSQNQNIPKNMSHTEKSSKKISKINKAKTKLKKSSSKKNNIYSTENSKSKQAIIKLKQLEEILKQANHKLHDIINFLPDATFVVDENKKVLIWNKAVEKMTGIKAKDIVGKGNKNSYEYTIPFYGEKRASLLDVILGQNDKILKKYSNINYKNETLSAESFAPALNKGKGATIFAKASLLRDSRGNIMGAIETIRDITKEKEIDKEKTEFVSLASHQLRTPITAISWYSEMLFKEEVGTLNEKQKKYLSEIRNGNNRMINLVDTLLTVSKIELGKFLPKLKKVSLNEILEDILKELSIKISARNVQIKRNYAPNLDQIESDPILLRIVLQNIISNAVEYVPQKGIVQIKTNINKDNTSFNVEIKDNGCGIPKKAQPKLFTKFFRADNARVIKTDGSGLGLYITKSITEMLKGNLSFKSEENEGATFLVNIPCRGMFLKNKK